MRRMTRREVLDRRETKVRNCETTPQAMWPTAKSLMKRDEPKASIAIRGTLGLKYHPLEKANATVD